MGSSLDGRVNGVFIGRPAIVIMCVFPVTHSSNFCVSGCWTKWWNKEKISWENAAQGPSAVDAREKTEKDGEKQ